MRYVPGFIQRWFMGLTPETRANWLLRGFTLVKIPLIFYLRPKVLTLREDCCEVRIPLRRRSKNHLGSMYFAALAAGADLTGGIIALTEILKSGRKIPFVFKDCYAEFLKRADGDTVFTCTELDAVREMVTRAVASGEREEAAFAVVATVPKKYGNEPVARFRLTLSVKCKD